MKQRSPYIAMLLAFLVPGGGHFYLGRAGRAAAFFAVVVLMFFTGLAIDGKLYAFISGQPLNNLATLGSMGSGLLYFLTRTFAHPVGDVGSITFEYGTAFTLTAGLMNLLLVLDSYDIAEERKD